MVIWALGILAATLVGGGLALQVAIARNGPAVLSSVDRFTGGNGDAVVLARISTGEHAAQKLVIWGSEKRNSGEKLPVIVFAHGGSWRSGDPDDYGFFARAFVPEGFIVVLVGYRLVSEERRDGVWPAMIKDTARAVRITHEQIAQYGGDPDRIVLAGHSAGAYNVMMTAMDPRWLADEGLSPDIIEGVVGLSGPYDFYPFDSDSTIAAFGNAPVPAETQVASHLRGEAPPMLLIHGGKDTLVGVHNSRDLAAQISAKRGEALLKVFPDMAHNDPLISLASPWRQRRGVAQAVAQFARDPQKPANKD